MTTYITSAGDTVDYIAYKYYGTLSGLTAEQLLNANPGIADLGPVLPSGIVLTMPVIATATIQTSVRLWS